MRIQPYVSPEVHRKLRTYSATRELTESAVTEAALVEYLERDSVEQALVLRRLDAVTQTVTQLQHDLDVLSQAFGIFAHDSFLNPPPVMTPDAKRRAESDYALFLATIARQLKAGLRFAGEVGRARVDTAATRPDPGSLGGR